MPTPSATYLTSKQVERDRYNRRPPFLHRLLRSDPDFPRPIYIAGRRYWLLSDLEAYEAAEARRVPPVLAADSACAMKRKAAVEARSAA